MKRLFDIVFSIIGLIIFSPIICIFLILVFLNDWKSPIYIAPRGGKFGKIFNIVKIRSMVFNADKNKVDSTSSNDKRITKIGKIIRKFKLDEITQLWNVLLGDMSFVGPRPERQFYAEQLLLKAPHYTHIYKVKPGITSWGMVKYGYAENLEEMLDRLKYDILYIENMSFLIDLKIMIHTVLIILQGRGK